MADNKKAARDALHGLALGDAFGETFFVPDRATPETPWRWTDDTAMALALLSVLREHGHVDQDSLAVAFAEMYEADPHRNYGASMHDVLRAIGAGEPWREVTRRQFDGQGSWGNGAAMRVVPLGAWFADDLDTVVAQATLSTTVTHAHPDTVPFAVWCAAAYPDDLVAALEFTAAGGGDVDTTCAMVGGIVAARTGVAAVPAHWSPEPVPGWVDRFSTAG